MTKIINVVFLLFSFHLTVAQSLYTTGKVKDQRTGLTLNSVTVSLNDSITGFKRYTKTDSSGTFIIQEIPTGNYKLTISHIGYDSIVINIRVDHTTKPIDVKLIQSSVYLSEVKVSAEKKAIENIPGGLSYTNTNKAALPNQTLDLLKQIPGVTLGSNGSIKLNGTTVSVYIDNSKMTLSGEDLLNYLRSLPDNTIQSIEALQVPPAKYDAEGASVINIITKKQKELGSSGNFALSTSTFPSLGADGIFFLKLPKLAIRLSTTFNTRRENGHESRTLVTNDNFITEGDSRNKNKSTSQLYMLDVDIPLNSGSRFTLISKFNLNTYANRYNLKQTSKSLVEPREKLINNRKLQSSGNYSQIGFLYNTQFRNKSTFSSEFSYAPFEGCLLNNFSDQTSFEPPNQLITRKQTSNNTNYQYDFYIGKFDFLYPFKNNSKLEAGAKVGSTKIENILISDTLNDQNNYVKDSLISNALNYTENILAAYLNYAGSIKKLKYQIGIRVENTFVKIISPSLNRTYNLNYLNYFPSLSLIYPNNSGSFGLDIARKIQRPTYNMLNPFLNKANPSYYLQGNPFLKPAFINQIQFKYIQNWNKTNMTMFSMFATQTDNLFAAIVKPYGDNILLETGENYLKITSFGSSIFNQSKIADWWSLNSNITFITAQYRSSIPQTGAFPRTTYFLSNTTNQFSIERGVALQIGFNFTSKYRYGQFLLGDNGRIDIGASKKIFKNKGSIFLTISDVLNTDRNRIGIINPSYSSTVKTKNQTRGLTLRLQYNFGKTKSTLENKKQLEENNRKGIL